MALLSEPTTVIGMALKYLGYSMNTTRTGAQIDEAVELLIRAKSNIKTFAPDNGQDLLLSGEVDLTMEWNGDILQVMEEDDEISYVVPKEGGLLWQDCLSIPANGAPNPENAHAFINFIHDAEVNAAIAEYIYYATANAAAKELMDAGLSGKPGGVPVRRGAGEQRGAALPGPGDSPSTTTRHGRASKRRNGAIRRWGATTHAPPAMPASGRIVDEILSGASDDKAKSWGPR